VANSGRRVASDAKQVDREGKIADVLQLGPRRAQTWKIDNPAGALLIGPAIRRDLHYHATPNFVISLDQPLRLTVNGRLVTGGSLLIDANTAHSSEGGPALIAWIHLNPLHPLEKFKARMRQIEQGCWVDHSGASTLRLSVSAFLDEPSYPQDLKRVLHDFLYIEKDPRSFADLRIAEAVAMLDAEPAEPISLSDLSRRFRMSESAFRRQFKAVTGVNFRRYRLWAKLKLAAELVHADRTFTDAAHEAGFSSSAHLSFAYRSMCGVAPSTMLSIMKDGIRPSDITGLSLAGSRLSDSRDPRTGLKTFGRASRSPQKLPSP